MIVVPITTLFPLSTIYSPAMFVAVVGPLLPASGTHALPKITTWG